MQRGMSRQPREITNAMGTANHQPFSLPGKVIQDIPSTGYQEKQSTPCPNSLSLQQWLTMDNR